MEFHRCVLIQYRTVLYLDPVCIIGFRNKNVGIPFHNVGIRICTCQFLISASDSTYTPVHRDRSLGFVGFVIFINRLCLILDLRIGTCDYIIVNRRSSIFYIVVAVSVGDKGAAADHNGLVPRYGITDALFVKSGFQIFNIKIFADGIGNRKRRDISVCQRADNTGLESNPPGYLFCGLIIGSALFCAWRNKPDRAVCGYLLVLDIVIIVGNNIIGNRGISADDTVDNAVRVNSEGVCKLVRSAQSGHLHNKSIARPR